MKFIRLMSGSRDECINCQHIITFDWYGNCFDEEGGEFSIAFEMANRDGDWEIIKFGSRAKCKYNYDRIISFLADPKQHVLQIKNIDWGREENNI